MELPRCRTERSLHPSLCSHKRSACRGGIYHLYGRCEWARTGSRIATSLRCCTGHVLQDDTFFFPDKNPLFPHNRFSTIFFSMKMAELGGNVLVSCIIDFDDIQLCLRQFCLNLNICKVMTIFLNFWPKKISSKMP